MIILKTNCPKCNKSCTSEYDGDKTEDDIYYSCKELMFTCNNCRQGFGPYHFTVPSHKVLIQKEQVK